MEGARNGEKNCGREGSEKEMERVREGWKRRRSERGSKKRVRRQK